MHWAAYKGDLSIVQLLHHLGLSVRRRVALLGDFGRKTKSFFMIIVQVGRMDGAS